MSIIDDVCATMHAVSEGADNDMMQVLLLLLNIFIVIESIYRRIVD